MQYGDYAGIVRVVFVAMLAAGGHVASGRCAADTQGGRPALEGVVVDPTAAGVPGAKVILRRAGGAGPVVGAADATGAFRFEGLAPGRYRITAEHDGLKAGQLTVKVPSAAPMIIRMSLAELQSEITVTDRAVELSTNAAENVDIVSLDRQALDDLPILDQDIVASVSKFLDAGSVATGGVAVIVDGVEARRIGVSASAIQEVRINQDPYSAEFPMPAWGRMEVITKPGSDSFHGTLNLLLRDYRFNARNPFALARPFEQRRVFEGSFTGPLGTDRRAAFVLTANREEDDQQAVIFAEGASGPIRQTLPIPSRNTELTAGINSQAGAGHVISMRGLYSHRTALNQGAGGLNLPEAATDLDDRNDILFFNHRGPLTRSLYSFFGMYVARQRTPITSVSAGPKIVVLGAFTGGGAQADRLYTENHIALNHLMVRPGQKHTVRFGVNVPDISRRGSNDFTDMAGTYTFAGLEDYAAGRPLSLTRQSGDGRLIFVEKVIGAFVQDEIKLRPGFQLTAGLRYDWQSYFGDHDNFAPRASFAYAPGTARKTVLRGGAGFFYDRTGPGPIADLMLFSGPRLRRYVLVAPPYPHADAAGPSSIVRTDPAVRLPYLVQYGIGIERKLQGSTTLTAGYRATRGVSLFRSRDVNAPPPPFYLERPNPAFSVWRQIESSGDLKGDFLELGVRGKVTAYFTGMIRYMLGRTHNNTPGNALGGRGTVASFPADNYDLSGEWARADFDQLHRLNVLGTASARRYFKIGISLSMYSGAPFTMTTGRDENRDGSANDRPPGVPRNSLQGAAFAVLDLRWSRDLALSRGRRDKAPALTLGLDAFNVLNRVNYGTFVGNVNSPFFGKPVSAMPPRRIQATVRFRF